VSQRFRFGVAGALGIVLLLFAIYVVPIVPGVPRTQAELKFSVLDTVGDPLVCVGWGMPNPPFTPDTEYPRIVANLPTYLAIIRHERLPPTPLTHEDVVAVYRAWLKLNAVQLRWRNGYYEFELFPGPSPSEQLRNAILGKVDLAGRVYDVHHGADFGACPICLISTTPIATPDGSLPVSRIAVGMHVWSLDASGHRIDVGVARVVVRIDAPGSELIHLTLADGRELTASAPHRLADGRTLGSLRIGDPVDGAHVIAVRPIPDIDGRTYDLLPSSETGEYWAGGVLLQSTMHG
jgi:hypothetical protein